MIPLLRLGSKNVIALDLPTVGFVTFFAGGYHKIIANRLQANNKGNGTILSVTWVLAFNVKPQKGGTTIIYVEIFSILMLLLCIGLFVNDFINKKKNSH